MDKNILHLLNEINQSIVKFRGIYSSWAAANGISYNEMLVIYTLREYGYCTQRLICDSYMIPRQTMNNIITNWRNDGLIEIDKEIRIGHEKAFVLTEKGRHYVDPLFESLNKFETEAAGTFGTKKMTALADIMMEYMETLNSSLYKTK